ncbi:putative centromere protein C/Mif2/cnp3 [Helianthus anomalus]
MFVHLTKRTKFLVRVRSFPVGWFTNCLLKVQFVCRIAALMPFVFTNKSSTILEPTFQMDQLHDPADFFATYEKFENTCKELKKQRGEDPNEPQILTTARQRRPEIPRRKTSYRHHVYCSQPENDVLSSQEALQDTVESQPIHDSQHEAVTPNNQPKEKEVAGELMPLKFN